MIEFLSNLKYLEFFRFLLTLTVVEFFFAGNYRRRQKFVLRYVLTLAGEAVLIGGISALVFWVRPLLEGSFWSGAFNISSYIVAFLVTVMGMYFCYFESFWSYLICGVTSYAVQHVIYILSGIVFSAMFSSPNALEITQETYLCYIVIEYGIEIGMYLFSYFFLARIANRYAPLGELRTMSVVLCIVTLTIVLFLNEIRIHHQSESYSLDVLCRFFSLCCCFFIVFIRMGIFERNSIRNEMIIAKQLIEKSKTQFEIRKESMEVINRKCHDLKYILESAKKRELSLNGTDFAEMKHSIDVISSKVKTGNNTLDVILEDWNLYCISHGIEFTCLADAEKIAFLSDSDVYILFGNLMDNANRALSEFAEQQKWIRVTVKQSKGMLFVLVENPYTGNLVFEKELPLTTKEDGLYHGYGLKSVKYIVEKYKGKLYIKAEDGVFRVSLLIPVQKTERAV
ncbi:MAG: sensor histidine kinase [Clostridia bacterium]|nr:sensor histidine kinase [Clostridia bacterium]